MQRMTISVSDFVREAVRDKLRDVKVIHRCSVKYDST